MKFGPLSPDDAQGAVLAHAISVGDALFRKGRVLSATDIAAMKEAGIASIIAARSEDGDVPENIAASQLGQALAGDNTERSAAHTGRTNLYSGAHGLVLINAEAVNAINAIHESITIATLAPFEQVHRRQVLATIKIIPFAAPQWALDRALEIADRYLPVIEMALFTPKRIELISTTTPGMKPALLDKNRTVIAARAEALGSSIAHEQRCGHDKAAIAKAIIEASTRNNDLILVFGAAATTDRADVVPAGLVAAGGMVKHFGMPVDPGNLLLLGQIHGKPVVGLPGCARSPKINGLDFVLQRLCANLTVAPSDITSMGVGGLLKEIPTRPQPRDLSEPAAPRAPNITAIVLAAGRSTRMGEANKLLMKLHGTPMIARTVSAALASPATGVIVVTGHAGDEVKSVLSSLPVTFVDNPRFATGMSTSLHVGIAALPPDADGVLVCLGDMPAVSSQALAKLIAAFNPVESRAIIVPVFQGKRGNPVLFARQFMDEIMRTSGDSGARALLSNHPEAIYEVEMDDAGVLADADTQAAFAALEADFKT